MKKGRWGEEQASRSTFAVRRGRVHGFVAVEGTGKKRSGGSLECIIETLNTEYRVGGLETPGTRYCFDLITTV